MFIYYIKEGQHSNPWRIRAYTDIMKSYGQFHLFSPQEFAQFELMATKMGIIFVDKTDSED